MQKNNDEEHTTGLARIKRFIAANKLKYISSFVLLALISAGQLISPRITGMLVDYISSDEVTQRGAMRYVLILLIISLLLLVLHFLSRQLLMISSNKFAHNERTNIFSRILDLSMEFFSGRSTGEVMALATNDVEAIRHMLGRGVMIFFNMIFVMISSILIIGGTISFDMALLLLVPMPLVIFVMAKFGIVINKRFRNVQQAFQNMTEKAQENIIGIRVVKAFSQELHESDKFAGLNRENYTANMSLVKIQGVFSPLVSLIMDMGQLFVLLFGGSLALKGTITLGDFIALNSYVGIIMSPIRMIGNLITLLQRGRASLSRITEALVLQPDIYDGKYEMAEIIPEDTPYVIEFRSVDFRYPGWDKYALRNISFGIKEGATLGIIGKIGSGKSTVASLALRLYDTQNRNKILIQGKDIAAYKLKELRDLISYVPQENILFSDTFKNNIDFMPEKHTESEVQIAAAKSKIFDMIMSTEKGFDSVIGERGVNISGGEKQRLSIARAIIKSSRIMILDDCLSAVDTDTEREIIESLREERKNRATIIISHRISSVKDADEIIVLKDGTVAERGTHDQLLESGGIYNEIYKRQTLEQELMHNGEGS